MFADQRIACCYLYPSDHFGLKARFVISQKGLQIRDNQHKRQMAALATSTQFRSLKTMVLLRVGFGVLLLLFLLSLIAGVCILIWRIIA